MKYYVNWPRWNYACLHNEKCPKLPLPKPTKRHSGNFKGWSVYETYEEAAQVAKQAVLEDFTRCSFCVRKKPSLPDTRTLEGEKLRGVK
jgi:hypothetical protein